MEKQASPSSSSSSELFFSESANSLDILLEEQDIIIDDLRKELQKTKVDVKESLVGCMKILNELYRKLS